jgi:cyclophilin family peptidyl-prolyl cis-trans isomerase
MAVNSFFRWDLVFLVGTSQHTHRLALTIIPNLPQYAKLPQLDGKYTIIGKVIDGLDTLDALEKLPVDDKYRPLASDVRIRSVTVHANPIADQYS